MKNRCDRAFTLIELLVVIAVIALLAGMLLPALAKAKARSQSIKCAPNMRQISLAVTMHADEREGALPIATNFAEPESSPHRVWVTALARFIGSRGCCFARRRKRPSSAAAGPTAVGTRLDTTGRRRSIRAEWRAHPRSPSWWACRSQAWPCCSPTRRVGQSRKSTRATYLARKTANETDLIPGARRRWSPTALVAEMSSKQPGQLKPVLARHEANGDDSGRSNLVLADGHVEAKIASSILQQDAGANLVWDFVRE